MSTDRLTELLNYMSAFSRDFGEFRQEFKQHRQDFNQFREETKARLDKIEHRMEKGEKEMREMRRTLDIVGSGVLAQRAKIDELDERVSDLEGERA